MNDNGDTPDALMERMAKREQQKARMEQLLLSALVDPENAARSCPWTAAITYYDGLGWQLMDAEGKPILQALIMDAEDVATIVNTVNNVAAAVAAEREACKLIARSHRSKDIASCGSECLVYRCCDDIADAIAARGTP